MGCIRPKLAHKQVLGLWVPNKSCFWVSNGYSMPNPKNSTPQHPDFKKLQLLANTFNQPALYTMAVKLHDLPQKNIETKKKFFLTVLFRGAGGSHIFDKTSSATNPTVCTWICRDGDNFFQKKYFSHVL